MMRKIGDQVFVVADNYGSPATIIDIRDDDGHAAPASHYKVKTDTGDAFWAFDFEIDDVVSEAPEPTGYDSTKDTLDHIAKVKARIEEITMRLNIRAIWHDRSKLSEPEKSGYDQLTIKLKDCVYGSDEYKAALEEAKPVIARHYAVNSHHPENYEQGIAGMSLLDIIEMLADWKGASERTKQGSIAQACDR
jgi:hypothetical protein